MAISDYQAGFDDGYTAAQSSSNVYAIGDDCEYQSTRYCNGFIAGYSTAFCPVLEFTHNGCYA